MVTRKRSTKRRVTRRRAPAAPPSAPPPLLRRRFALREPPHAHSVCRQCGRIAEVEVTSFDAEQLKSFATAVPPDWAIEGISVSVTGYCPRCRQGLPRA